MTAPTADLSLWTPHGDRSRIVSLPNGNRLQVFEGGRGEPLLFLHGFGLQRGWNETLDMLSNERRVIAPLFAGFGESTGIEHIDDMLDAIVYLNDVLDTLDLRRVDIVGFDLGGMFAAELATVTPERAGRLVLVAPFGLWRDEEPPRDFFALPLGELPAALFDEPESDAARAYFADPESDQGRLEVTIQRQRALAATSKFLWPIPDKGLGKRLHRISAPTLVVWGRDDALIPASYANDFASAIAGATTELVPGGHMVPFEQPQVLAGTIERFLRD